MLDVQSNDLVRKARNLIVHSDVRLERDGSVGVGTLRHLREREVVLGFEEFLALARLLDSKTQRPQVPYYVARFIASALENRGIRSVHVISGSARYLALGIAHYGKSLDVRLRIDERSEECISELSLNSLFAPSGNLHAMQNDDEVVDCFVTGPSTSPRTGMYGKAEEPALYLPPFIVKNAERNAQGLVVAWLPKRMLRLGARRSLRNGASAVGFSLAALLDVPSYEVEPGKRGATDYGLAFLERRPSDRLFVAELPKAPEEQIQLVERLKERRPGPEPRQGCLVDEKSFSGLAALECTARLARVGKQRGLVPAPVSAVIEVVRRLDNGNASTAAAASPNSLYISNELPREISCSPRTLTSARGWLSQLVVNPAFASSQYLSMVLNGEVGAPLREAMADLVAPSQRVVLGLLGDALYLPPRPQQDEAVDAHERIQRLRSELYELELQIEEQPRKISVVLEQLSRFNHPDSIELWAETLPFPLGSIFRTCTSQQGRYKDQYEALLHFFEATAAFLATVHLSALIQDPVLWVEVKDKIDRQLQSGRYSWDVPTFGLWRTVLEVCVGTVRKPLNADKSSRAQALALYAFNRAHSMEVFTNSQVLEILSTANSRRNLWHAHGGALGEPEAESRFNELWQLVVRLRTQVGRCFSTLQVIIPGTARTLPGPIFDCEVRIAAGSNPAFLTQRVRLAESPLTGHLHLLEEGQQRALCLAGLVQIRDAPQPACYFYNRYDKEGTHFVSYHYEPSSRVIDRGFPAPDIGAILNKP